MLNTLLIVLAAFSSTPVLAHEGHDEPKVMPAPKGGITRANEKYFFEYVYAKEGGRIYLYTLDEKPAPVAAIVEARAEFDIPRQKAPIVATVTPDGSSWVLAAALPKTHRVTLRFTIKSDGHDDKFKFVAETKKK